MSGITKWFPQTGWHSIPCEASLRGIFVVSMIFAYVTNLFFSAALTSNLASETIPIKSSKELQASRLELYGDRRLPIVYEIIRVITAHDYILNRTNCNLINYFNFCVLCISYVNQIFFQTKYHQRKQKFEETKITSNFVHVRNAAKIVRDKPVAFITFEDAAKRIFKNAGYSDQYFCRKISSLDDVIPAILQNAMFVKRGSSLREIFNRK
jgi:hypothetical protein